MNWVLFGFKNCGKTRLGKELALRLDRPFFDTDAILEELYLQKTGIHASFRTIFKTEGEKAFRALEGEVVETLIQTQRAVISVGGGLILTPPYATLLAKEGKLIYLHVSKATLKERTLSQRELPAYLDPQDPEGSFERMYAERLPHYEKIEALKVNAEDATQGIEELHKLAKRYGK